MSEDDKAFAEAFGGEEKPREKEPQKAQEPVKEEAAKAEPLKVRQPEAITAQEPEASKEPPPQKAEPAKEPEKPKVDPEQFRGYLDEREKRQQAERELAELRRQVQQSQQKPKEPPPDIYENPDGYRQHLEAQYDQRLTKMKLEQSEFLATRDYGAELVGEVKDWALRLDDARANHLISQPSPFHAAVEMFRQEKASAALKEYDYDLEKLKAKWLAEQGAQTPPAQVQTQGDQPAQTLPPKIAGTGGALGKAPTPSEDMIFRSVFSR